MKEQKKKKEEEEEEEEEGKKKKKKKKKEEEEEDGTVLNTFNIVVFRRQQWLPERTSLFFIRTHFAGFVFRLPSAVCFEEGSEFAPWMPVDSAT
jgi:hypothetical protein